MKRENIRKIQALISVALFVAIFCASYTVIAPIFEEKLYEQDRLHTFFKQKNDSLDIVFVGTSHLYYGISPMRLWKDHGISSFVAASPSQGVPCSYYLIKEAIHEQHPRLIVMDAYYLVHNIYARSKERLHEVVDPMPLTSKVRYEMIRDIVPNVKGEENEYSFYFTLGLYHSRWEVLKRSDFYPEYQFLKGVVLDEQK